VLTKLLKAISPTRFAEKLNPQTATADEIQTFFDKYNDANHEMVRQIAFAFENTDMIFDVGGNAGYFSRAILDTGYAGRIILFEPIKNLHEVSKTTLSDAAGNIEFVNAALSDEDGVLEMFMPHDGNIGWITAVKSKAKSNQVVTAKKLNAQPLFEKHRPGFIKIDVEGFEAFILEPLTKVINETYKPAVFVELGWGTHNPNWARTVACLKHLADLGYRAADPTQGLKTVNFEAIYAAKKTQDILFWAP
jgi:FkbM family methyltransferase